MKTHACYLHQVLLNALLLISDPTGERSLSVVLQATVQLGRIHLLLEAPSELLGTEGEPPYATYMNGAEMGVAPRNVLYAPSRNVLKRIDAV